MSATQSLRIYPIAHTCDHIAISSVLGTQISPPPDHELFLDRTKCIEKQVSFFLTALPRPSSISRFRFFEFQLSKVSAIWRHFYSSCFYSPAPRPAQRFLTQFNQFITQVGFDPNGWWPGDFLTRPEAGCVLLWESVIEVSAGSYPLLFPFSCGGFFAQPSQLSCSHFACEPFVWVVAAFGWTSRLASLTCRVLSASAFGARFGGCRPLPPRLGSPPPATFPCRLCFSSSHQPIYFLGIAQPGSWQEPKLEPWKNLLGLPMINYSTTLCSFGSRHAHALVE